MMKVASTLSVLEANGKECPGIDPPPEIKIHSHWNRSELVVLEADDRKYTVSASELQKAIINATNWGGY